MSERIDTPQDTLDLLILKSLEAGPMHGWAVSERIQSVSRDALQVPQGSLYPALHRLERRGWIRAEWGASENNRRAKFYELTRAGRKELAKETAAWDRHAHSARARVHGRRPGRLAPGRRRFARHGGGALARRGPARRPAPLRR